MGTFLSQYFCRRVIAVFLLAASGALSLPAAEPPDPADTNPPATPPKAAVETPSEAQQALRAYLQLQEQLHQTLLTLEQSHQTLLTLEQSRKDSEAAAQQNSDILRARLDHIEAALTRQRVQEVEIAENSSRFALKVAGALGGVGLLVMLFTGWFLMRTARQFSEIAALATQPMIGHTSPAGLLSDSQFAIRGDAVQASGGKLLGALERLEKRVYEIEHAALVPHHSSETATGDHRGGNGAPDDAKGAQIALLLGKGQSLLHLDQAESAIQCFDEILGIDPQNTEALVKKGAAFEKLKRLEDAIACYDHALAVDDSMTLAYLYKGGVFNQLERFSEALQCYEKALRTQQKVPVGSTA